MITAIIQARCGSSRLKNKIFLPLNDKPILQIITDKLKDVSEIDNIIVVTTTNIEDDNVYNFCNDIGVDCYRGEERDLLNRYYYLCRLIKSDIIIRLTADCPYLDINMLGNMILNFNCDYMYNTDENNSAQIYPEGSDIEICTFKTLEYIWKTEKEIREHSIGVIRVKRDHYKQFLDIKCYDPNLNLNEYIHNFAGIHLSIDNINDYEVAKFIFDHFQRFNFSYKEILQFIDLDKNYDTYLKIKNNPAKKRLGQQLYDHAKTVIPGGTQLLSKRPEMFLPNNWPAYYSKVEGCEVTDLDGVKYTDMGINGIGSCILGANDLTVNHAVIECITRGSMSTLNHPNEVYLTDKLIELHPWAGMARYTRASGEACAVAVRIARAYSKRTKIAFCGYHGWHDWYLATNINSTNLDKHLISGLSTDGVPSQLEGSIYPFTYNKIEELRTLLMENDIGVVIMEPMRSAYPEDDFLGKVRDLCDQYNSVLIFDEVTSGFRITNGGLHKLLNVNPDIAVFGKAISNGFPLGVILGRKSIMEAAQDTFISSTYWTEGIGFTAGLSTINKFVCGNVADHIKTIGEYFQTGLKDISLKHNIKLQVTGLPCITTFSFQYGDPLAIKTLFIQEMLKKKYLATCAFYVTYSHTKDIVDKYLKEIERFFSKYKTDMENEDIVKYLEGPICHSGFQRVN